MNDNFNILVHEASHAVAADFYGVPNYPELTPGGFSKVKQCTDPGTAGLCHLEPPFTEFQDAVISWAGILGQCMFATAPDWAPPFKPSEKMLRDFYMMAMHQLKKLSDSDRAGILQDYRHSWRAMRSAFKIVRKNRARILRLANAIAGRVDGSKWSGVPRSPHYPATHADFIHLVCGDDVASFERFIVNRAVAHLAGGAAENFEAAKKSMTLHFLGSVTDELRARHTGKTDAEIAGVLFDENLASILKLQRRIYGGDLPDAASWFAAARDFLNWAASVKNSTDQRP